jgi:hypothetical protein
MVKPIGLRWPSGLTHPHNENGLPDEWTVHFQNMAPPFLTGIFFSTTKETKGHKGKKAKKHPLCTSPALAPGASVVPLRGKGFPARNGRAQNL